ncbi:MAG: hypothetical protein AAGH76_11800 [Pseudomonadota bacterium]
MFAGSYRLTRVTNFRSDVIIRIEAHVADKFCVEVLGARTKLFRPFIERGVCDALSIDPSLGTVHVVVRAEDLSGETPGIMYEICACKAMLTTISAAKSH